MRISNTRQFVLKEFMVLKYLQEHGDNLIKRSIPKPIALHRFGSRYISSQNYIQAAKFKPPSWFDLKKKTIVEKHFDYLIRWLQSLWQVPTKGLTKKNVKGIDIFAELEFCFARCNGDSKEFYRKILSVAEDLHARNLPLVLNHNDLCLENIFFDLGSVRVIDWELSYLTLPIFDWFYFTVNYAHRFWSGRDRSMASFLKAVKRAFFECNWFSELVKNQTKTIYDTMQIDTSLIPLFYCLGIFDFFYRKYFPELIDLGDCAPLFRLEELHLAN